MKLDGITAIANFIGLSEATTLDKIRVENLPAHRTKEHTWEADTEKVSDWLDTRKKPAPADKTEAGYGIRKSGRKKSKNVSSDGKSKHFSAK